MNISAFVVVLGSLVGSSALAAPPWYGNTAESVRTEAAESFHDGHQLLSNGYYVRAAELLEQTLALWDHPAAHFDMAKARMNLADPVAALTHLWYAMRFGGQPLDLGRIIQIEEQSAFLVSEQIGRLVVDNTANQPLYVGGKKVLDGRGVWEGIVRAGAVAIGDATGAPFFVVVAGGTSASVKIAGTTHDASVGQPFGAAELRKVQRAVVGYEVTFPPASQRAAWRAGEPAKDAWVASDSRLPGAAASICDKAQGGDLATICRLYGQDHAALVEARNREAAMAAHAAKRLEEITRGGVVNSLH